MNRQPDFDQLMREWVDAGEDRLPTHHLHGALATIATTRQRGAMLAPLEDLKMRMQPFAPFIGVAAAVVVAVLIVTALSDRSVGGPAPTPSPTPSADAASTLTTAEAFNLPLSLALPSGWEAREAPAFFSVFRPAPQPDQSYERIIFADPGAMQVSEPAGRAPWPDDLYAWLNARPEFEPSDPQALTVGGRPATMYEAVSTYEPTATRPNVAIIQIGEQSAGEGTILVLSEGTVRWRLIEVDLGEGEELVIAYLHPADTFSAWAVEVAHILDSVRFGE